LAPLHIIADRAHNQVRSENEIPLMMHDGGMSWLLHWEKVQQ
jgi:hypothetical protein